MRESSRRVGRDDLTAVKSSRFHQDEGQILLCGDYGAYEDLDPTEGVDERPTNGGLDAFVTMVHADGSYGWSYTAGGRKTTPHRGWA